MPHLMNNIAQQDPLIVGFAGLANKLHVSRWTLRRHIEAGLLPAGIRISTHRIAWRESVVNEWLDKGGVAK
jgi:predicted DNA-binding transcriptional regulator AlpA